MKRIKLSVLFTLSLSLQLFSQDNNTEKFKIGFNVGANLFDLNQNDILDTYDVVTSYTFGLSFEYKINGKLSLLSNINYDNKIMRLENFRYFAPNDDIFLMEHRIKFNYLNIPANIRYHIGQNNKIFIDLGIFYNHFLNLKNITTRNDTGEKTTTFDFQNILKKYDYGISFGFGYKFNSSNKNHFSIEINDELGLGMVKLFDDNGHFGNYTLTALKSTLLS